MTGNTNKTRAVFLAALMIFSVFAGTVAFSGSAAAADLTYEGNAVHYANSSGTPIVEVPFSGGIDTTTVDNSSIQLLDDGDSINTDVVQGYDTREGSVVIVLNDTVPSNDLEVELSDSLVDAQNGNALTNPGEKSVVFAGQTVEIEGDDTGGGADVQDNSANLTAYQGVTLAINTTNASIPATVEGEDNNYFQEGDTGVNSTVFTFDTSDRELGQYKIYVNNSDDNRNRTYINVRDLQLDISVDDTNVTTEDTIETDVSAVASGRNFEAVLLDSGGDEVNTSEVNQLDGQGEADVDFDTSSADGGGTLDTGTYTVEVTDNATGVTVESSEITVSEADDESAEFTQNTITDERGDILEATIELTETSEATLSFGSSDDGVRYNATVEDDDGDDQVTVYINTYRMGDYTSENVYNLDSDSDDNIIAQNNDPATSSAIGTSDLIDGGNYDLEVQAGDVDDSTGAPGVESSDDVATVTLDERSVDNIRMWTGSSEELGTFSDLEDVNEGIEEGQVTQSSEIAVGDLAIHQIEASGFEGALDARANEDVTTEFETINNSVIELQIEEASPGANQDPAQIDLSYNDNVSVVADGPNDTYFVVVDTSDVQFRAPRNNEDLPNDDDTALETNFTILSDDESTVSDFTPEDLDDDEDQSNFVEFNANEPEVTVDTPFNVSQASGQTISGTTNIAPGTELTLRVRSQSGTSPSFLKTASPVVQPDDSFSATFDFSEQNVGDEYDIQVDSQILTDGPTEEEGQVVEGVATATPEPETDTPEPETDTPEPETDTPEPDTDTPEPDTATPEPETEEPTSTPTSTPGFGVVVALTALLAAALLAIRRD